MALRSLKLRDRGVDHVLVDAHARLVPDRRRIERQNILRRLRAETRVHALQNLRILFRFRIERLHRGQLDQYDSVAVRAGDRGALVEFEHVGDHFRRKTWNHVAPRQRTGGLRHRAEPLGDRHQGVDSAGNKDEGAGDQGIMFGYATNETSELMPAPIHYSHAILHRLAQVRKSGAEPTLGPDAKSQLSVRYENGKPVGVSLVRLAMTWSRDKLAPRSSTLRAFERSLRIGELRKLMERPDVLTSEKYRRVTEAYQIELDYGHTIEAYEGEITIHDTQLFIKIEPDSDIEVEDRVNFTIDPENCLLVTR